MKLEGVDGGYHYNTQGDPAFGQPTLFSIHGHFVEGSLLAGYEHVTDTLISPGTSAPTIRRSPKASIRRMRWIG